MFPFVFEINPAGWAHLAYFGLLIPVVVVRGYSPELNDSPDSATS